MQGSLTPTDAADRASARGKWRESPDRCTGPAGQRLARVGRGDHHLLNAVVQLFPVVIEDRLEKPDFAAVIAHQLGLRSPGLAGDGGGGGLFESELGEEALSGLE